MAGADRLLSEKSRTVLGVEQWGGRLASRNRARFHDPFMQLCQIYLAVNCHTFDERLARPSLITLEIIRSIGQ